MLYVRYNIAAVVQGCLAAADLLQKRLALRVVPSVMGLTAKLVGTFRGPLFRGPSSQAYTYTYIYIYI